jgi:hypothetical protein
MKKQLEILDKIQLEEFKTDNEIYYLPSLPDSIPLDIQEGLNPIALKEQTETIKEL